MDQVVDAVMLSVLRNTQPPTVLWTLHNCNTSHAMGMVGDSVTRHQFRIDFDSPASIGWQILSEYNILYSH